MIGVIIWILHSILFTDRNHLQGSHIIIEEVMSLHCEMTKHLELNKTQ